MVPQSGLPEPAVRSSDGNRAEGWFSPLPGWFPLSPRFEVQLNGSNSDSIPKTFLNFTRGIDMTPLRNSNTSGRGNLTL